MKIVKKTGEYTIIQKRSGRYGVWRSNRTWMNGEEKIAILVKEGFIKLKEGNKASEETQTQADGPTDLTAAEA